MKAKRKSDPEVLMMRVQKGALVPADSYTQHRLRDKGYHVGDLVGVSIKKIRNYGFHKLAHALGDFLVQNVEAFENKDAHSALKKLQIEAGIACDEYTVQSKGETVLVRVPHSLSFESMDDGVFREVYTAMCRHVAVTYFPELSPEQVVAMVEMMPQAA